MHFHAVSDSISTHELKGQKDMISVHSQNQHKTHLKTQFTQVLRQLRTNQIKTLSILRTKVTK